MNAVTLVYILMSVTVNIHTGDASKPAFVSGPYNDVQTCVAAAVDKGPQKPEGDVVKAYVCRAIETKVEGQST